MSRKFTANPVFTPPPPEISTFSLWWRFLSPVYAFFYYFSYRSGQGRVGFVFISLLHFSFLFHRFKAKQGKVVGQSTFNHMHLPSLPVRPVRIDHIRPVKSDGRKIPVVDLSPGVSGLTREFFPYPWFHYFIAVSKNS